VKVFAFCSNPGQTLRLAAAAVVLGSLWDISWDASIGRHSFWSPPHLLVNAGAVLAAIAAVGFMRRAVLPERATGLLAACSALAMAVAEVLLWAQPVQPSALDVDSSAPTLAVGGMLGIVLAAWIDSASAPRTRPLAETLAAGLALTMVALTLGAYSLPNLQRTALFLQLSAAVYPAVLFVAAGSRGAWSATRAACMYTGIVLVFVWFLPLFPATPATGPVYEATTHMLPPRFPLLLLLPALGIDLCVRWFAHAGVARTALAAVVFVATFFPAQWHFAAFLLSPASDNRFFAGGGRFWPFFIEVGAERSLFWGQQQSPVDATAVVAVVALAFASTAVGALAARGLEALRARR